MAKASNLTPKVLERFCPNCFRIVSQLEIELSNYNYSCPNPSCDKKYSDFKPLPTNIKSHK